MVDENEGNVVNLNLARIEKELKEKPDLEVVIAVAMTEHNCQVQILPSSNAGIDMEDRETVRRICSAMNTVMHAFMREYGIRTLKPQRQRLKRKK